jgi:hypothetical protein
VNRHRGLAHAALEKRLEKLHAQGNLPRGYIDGLTLSNDTTDATNDIAIAAGVARSTVSIVNGAASTFARDQIDLDLPVGIIKQLDVAWAPENYDDEGYSGGDRSGGRSASAISNTTWHIFAIGGRGVPADVMFHDSATQSSVLAALPSGFSAYRHIMSVCRVSAAILAFKQLNDEVLYTTVPAVNGTNGLDTTPVNFVLAGIPLGIRTCGIFNIAADSASTPSIYVYSPDLSDQAASDTVAPLSTVRRWSGGVGFAGNQRIRTDASAQVRAVATAASTTISITTLGFVHPRGRDA